MSLQDRFFPQGEEFAVTNTAGKVPMVFSPVYSTSPLVMDFCRNALGLLRIAGSTTGLNKAWCDLLMKYVMEVFGRGAYVKPNTVLMSGGWRVRHTNGRVSPTVLEVPQMVQRLNPRCKTLGSLPLTSESMCFYGPHSTFAPIASPGPEVQPNPGNDLLWIVHGSARLGWDGDVAAYADLMDRLRTQDKATGLLIFGGGGVTAYEIEQMLRRHHPVAIATEFGGFGNELVRSCRGEDGIDARTQAILDKWRDNRFEPKGFEVLRSPEECSTWLTAQGFMES